MRKFFILCLMAFVMCVNANGQQRFEDGIYQIRQATSTRLTAAQYESIKGFALKSGNTFHFEYEPTMYAKGVRNQRIGYNTLLYGNIAYGVINGFVWALTLESIDIEQAYKTTIVSSCIVGILDVVATCYIYIGSNQKNKSAIAISPSGVKFTF